MALEKYTIELNPLHNEIVKFADKTWCIYLLDDLLTRFRRIAIVNIQRDGLLNSTWEEIKKRYEYEVNLGMELGVIMITEDIYHFNIPTEKILADEKVYSRILASLFKAEANEDFNELIIYLCSIFLELIKEKKYRDLHDFLKRIQESIVYILNTSQYRELSIQRADRFLEVMRMMNIIRVRNPFTEYKHSELKKLAEDMLDSKEG